MKKKKIALRSGPKMAVNEEPKKEVVALASQVALNVLANEMAEVRGDLNRLVGLMADQWGDVFRVAAREIITKKQGPEF